MDAVVIADRMAALRAEIEARETEYKGLAAQLLETLQTTGEKRAGRFTRAQRQSLKIVSSEGATQWAQEHYCLKVDTTKAMRIIRREFAVPECFAIETSEYITSAGRTEEPQE